MKVVVEIPTKYEVYRFGPFDSYDEAHKWCESKELTGHNPFYNPCLLYVDDAEGPETEQCIREIKHIYDTQD